MKRKPAGRSTFAVRREMRGFAIGSLFFALGSLPGYVGLVGVTADNLTYFLGRSSSRSPVSPSCA